MGARPRAQVRHPYRPRHPKQAVRDNLPIANSNFHAEDAADTTDTCPWDDGDYGIRDTAAGQAYYNSMLKLYAEWGVDFVKVDCVADHPYKASEIRQIAAAIKKTGRSIILSLSPGPTQLSHAAEVGQNAQMWRIADDVWDGWSFAPAAWPNGVVTAFDNLAKWSPYAKPGNWPDADMLPFGSLTPHPGWGEPRLSRLTADEERTQFTLWAVARSPLILGGDLTELDEFTKSLITNRDMIELDQMAWDSHPVDNLPSGFEHARVWVALARKHKHPTRFVAFFNLDDKPVVSARRAGSNSASVAPNMGPSTLLEPPDVARVQIDRSDFVGSRQRRLPRAMSGSDARCPRRELGTKVLIRLRRIVGAAGIEPVGHSV